MARGAATGAREGSERPSDSAVDFGRCVSCLPSAALRSADRSSLAMRRSGAKNDGEGTMAERVRAGLFEQRARCLSRLGYAFFSAYFSRRFCPRDARTIRTRMGALERAVLTECGRATYSHLINRHRYMTGLMKFDSACGGRR